MNDEYIEGLMRGVIAHLMLSTALQVSRDMFGKSYTALSQTEKVAVDNFQAAMIGSNMRFVTPDLIHSILTGQSAQPAQQEKTPVGFQPPAQT